MVREYVRVSYKPHPTSKGYRTVLLEVIYDTSPTFLIGFEVDGDGGRTYTSKFDERKHIIDKTTIVKITPLIMNLHYGVLVPKPDH